MFVVKNANGARTVFGTFRAAYVYAQNTVGASWPKQIETRNGQEVTR